MILIYWIYIYCVLFNQKQKLTKAFQNAVGWKSFKKDISVDTYLYLTNSRMNSKHASHQEEGTFQSRLLKSVILKQHNISKFQGTVDATRSYNNVKRTDCVLIAIKPFADNTLTSCKAQNVYDMFNISSKIDALAKLHGVTFVRKFGDVWIGCLGFFPNVGRAVSENLQAVLRMAKDVHLYGEQNNFNFTCALDYGNIFCGFFRGIFQFEVLGPEVMWILSVCEFERQKKIFVSDSMHTLCKRLLSNPNNPQRFESIFLQYVDKFHSGCNYVLILDVKKMQQARPSGVISSKKNIIDDKVCDINYNLVTCNGQQPSHLIELQSADVCEDAHLHMASTLSILHSLLIDDFYCRARSVLKKIKAGFLCSSATIGITTTTTTPYSASTNNVADGIAAPPPPPLWNTYSPPHTYNEQPYTHTVLFDEYPGMTFDISANVAFHIKRIFKKISCGQWDACCTRLGSDYTNNNEHVHSTTRSEMRGRDGFTKPESKKSFESFRQQTLEPSGYVFSGYVTCSLFLSIWAVLFIKVEGSKNNAALFDQLSLNMICLFMATAFFNWAVPLLGSSSLLFPLCNVVLVWIYPKCALGGDLGKMVILPTWMVLCYSHRLSHMACSILTVSVIAIGLREHTDECKGGGESILFALLGFFFLSTLCILEYILYLCYIVEIILIPYEKDVLLCYEEAMKDIHQQLPVKMSSHDSREKGILNHVVHGDSQPTNALSSRFHCFQRCVVIAVHVKAVETIPDVGAVDHVSNMLEYIYSLFDESIDKFGIIGKALYLFSMVFFISCFLSRVRFLLMLFL